MSRIPPSIPLGAAFYWLEMKDRWTLRFNAGPVAWVLRDGDRWIVELHTWRRTISHPVASPRTGRRYIERWVQRQGMFWMKPRRGLR